MGQGEREVVTKWLTGDISIVLRQKVISESSSSGGDGGT